MASAWMCPDQTSTHLLLLCTGPSCLLSYMHKDPDGALLDGRNEDLALSGGNPGSASQGPTDAEAAVQAGASFKILGPHMLSGKSEPVCPVSVWQPTYHAI